MHPIALRNKWEMTNVETAFWLGKSEQTIKEYAAGEKSKSHRNPPKSVLIMCDLLDKNWQVQGKPEFNPVLFYSPA